MVAQGSWLFTAFVHTRLWTAFIGSIFLWTGVWALIDEHTALGKHVDEHDIEELRSYLLMLLGAALMLVTRTFVWNSGIHTDEWMDAVRPAPLIDPSVAKQITGVVPPLAAWRCVDGGAKIMGTYLLAYATACAATFGAIAGWIGIYNLLLPYDSLRDAFLQLLFAFILMLGSNSLAGASNRGGGNALREQAHQEALASRQHTTTTKNLKRKRKRQQRRVTLMQDKLKSAGQSGLGGSSGSADSDDNVAAGFYTTYEIVIMYAYTYTRAICGFAGMNVCWSGIISLMNNHIGNGGNDKTEQGVYIIVGFTLVNLFGTSKFAEEAGVDLESNHSAASKQAKLGSTRMQFLLREVWRNVRTAMYLFGMIIFWTAIENILLLQPDSVPDLATWSWIMIGVGVALLLMTGTFFSVVGVPPPAFIVSHLDPRVGTCCCGWGIDGRADDDHRVPIMIPGDEKSFRQLPGRVSVLLQSQVNADGAYQPPTLMKRNPAAKFEPGKTPRESTFNLVESDSDDDDEKVWDGGAAEDSVIAANNKAGIANNRNEFSLRPPALKQAGGVVSGVKKTDDSDSD